MRAHKIVSGLWKVGGYLVKREQPKMRGAVRQLWRDTETGRWMGYTLAEVKQVVKAKG